MSTRPESTPDPVDPRCGDPVVEENVAFLRERSRVGQAKYGTLLTREDLTPEQWVDHIREELGDALNYATRVKREMDAIVAAEQARWQNAIYSLVHDSTGKRPDGAGCDSGDPLDLSLAEVAEGINHFANRAHDLEDELACFLESVMASECVVDPDQYAGSDRHWGWHDAGKDARTCAAGDRLVAIGRWECSPERPGFYRPLPPKGEA